MFCDITLIYFGIELITIHCFLFISPKIHIKLFVNQGVRQLGYLGEEVHIVVLRYIKSHIAQ